VHLEGMHALASGVLLLVQLLGALGAVFKVCGS
jgi:hypothetical protein